MKARVSEMNDLSWLIYAAGVVGNIQAVLIIMSTLSACVVGLMVLFVAMDESYDPKMRGSARKSARLFWIPVACALVASLLPSSRTIYMIAASEIGETVVTSPDAQEMLSDLKAIIKKRLKDELTD